MHRWAVAVLLVLTARNQEQLALLRAGLDRMA